jgi:toxin ParE1/3/4
VSPRAKLSPAAARDLEEIWLYVAADKPGAADRLIDDLSDRCRALALNPHIGRRRDELRPGLRSFPHGRYVIFYRVDDAAGADRPSTRRRERPASSPG